MNSQGRLRVVLVGAGHAHLHVIDRAGELRAGGVELTVVAPAEFHYSGLASASATGALPAPAARIDIGTLTSSRGVVQVVGRATGIDPRARCLVVDDGRRVSYDAVSFNVGSVAATGTMQVDAAVPIVKPLDRLQGVTSWLERTDPDLPAVIDIVGGGATGLELAGHLSARRGPRTSVHVFERDRIGASLPLGARRRAQRRLSERGVVFHPHTTVSRVAVDHVLAAPSGTTDETRRSHDLAIVATGLTADPIVTALGIGDAQGIPIRDTLQHIEDDRIYAVGDCARFVSAPLPKIGVHAVRQGPVLVASFLARQAGRALPRFAPQQRALQIVDLGGGTAVAARGRWWFEGAAARRLKLAIDHRWLARYR